MGTHALTDRKLKSLRAAADGRPYDVKDTEVRGLRVRVMPNTKTFVLLARFPGNKQATRQSLGTYGELTLEEARDKARAWRNQLKKKIDPRAEEEKQRLAQQRKQENSFASVCEEFIKRHVKKTRKANVVERELRREFVARWGARPITDITQHDVVAVIDEAVDRGAPYQAHNLLGHVRTLFNWAIARGVYGLDKSPCDRMRPAAVIGKKQARRRVLFDQEMRAFWRASKGIGYPYGPLFQMLLLTGQRKSEVAEARWSEFDLQKKLWVIPPERMKADAAHIVPLSDDVLAILKALPRFKSGDCLFSTTFGKMPVNGFSKAKDRLDELIEKDLGKAEPFVLHDLRRTFRTGLSAIPGISDLVRELVIGHAKPGLHKVYDQYTYLDEKRFALDAWAARLRTILNPTPANVVELRAAQ